MLWKALNMLCYNMLPGTDFRGWWSKVELRRHNIWSIIGQASSSVTSLFVSQERSTFSHFQGVEGFLFSRFQKRETTFPFPEQFISLLDKTPCYIYPTKIADDILPAALLSSSLAHGPVNHTSYNRTRKQERWNPQPDRKSKRKDGKKENMRKQTERAWET